MSNIYMEIARELERRDFASFPVEDGHTFSDGFVRKMELIIASFHRRKSTLAGKKRLILIAAVIAALIFGVLCAGAAYKKYYHYVTDCGICSFFRFDDDDYYDSYVDRTVPSSLETYYAPTYIPDGYLLEDMHKTEISNFLSYAYPSDNTYRIYYRQCLLSAHFTVDTEDAEVSYIKRNGDKYLCVAKNESIYLSWTDNSYAFSLCIFGSLDTDEALKIAESLAAQ